MPQIETDYHKLFFQDFYSLFLFVGVLFEKFYVHLRK
ncbi:MAG: hypothetical protein KatS3mg027_0464 [Bacteroidia bacterium]|nr:MAG: hypothetical protein KatS3mg027_0464 [Bacteroidia bacterium]